MSSPPPPPAAPCCRDLMHRVLVLLGGLLWHQYDEHRRRLVVWRGGDVVEVIDLDYGDVVQTWPLQAPPERHQAPDVEDAAATVRQRLAAGH